MQPSVEGAVAPATYAWTPGASLDDPSSPTPTGTVSQTTTFMVTVTDDRGCEVMASITVHVLPPILDHASEWLDHGAASPATDLNGDNALDVLDLIDNVNTACVVER